MWTLRTRFIVGAILAAAIFGALLIQAIKVPVRKFQFQPLLSRESPTEIVPDASVQQLIRRAQRDFYVFPIDGLGHRLTFLRAWRVPPNDVYLSFWPPGISDITVRYRCSLEDRRLLWKAFYSE